MSHIGGSCDVEETYDVTVQGDNRSAVQSIFAALSTESRGPVGRAPLRKSLRDDGDQGRTLACDDFQAAREVADGAQYMYHADQHLDATSDHVSLPDL